MGRRTGLSAATAVLVCMAIVLVVGTADSDKGPSLNAWCEPIYIFGDEGFPADCAVVSGQGTARDPYVIEGYSINVLEADYGIYIDHTDSYFVIRGCTIENAKAAGITLNSAVNGRIEGCTLRRNGVGIYLLNSSYNTLADNVIVENYYGVVLEAYSCHNTMGGNDWRDNGLDVLDRGENNVWLEAPPEESLKEALGSTSSEAGQALQTEAVVVPPSVAGILIPAGQTPSRGPVIPLEMAEEPGLSVQTPSAVLVAPQATGVEEVPAPVQTSSNEASE